jgi:hypothetical protein
VKTRFQTLLSNPSWCRYAAVLSFFVMIMLNVVDAVFLCYAMVGAGLHRVFSHLLFARDGPDCTGYLVMLFCARWAGLHTLCNLNCRIA